MHLPGVSLACAYWWTHDSGIYVTCFWWWTWWRVQPSLFILRIQGQLKFSSSSCLVRWGSRSYLTTSLDWTIFLAWAAMNLRQNISGWHFKGWGSIGAGFPSNFMVFPILFSSWSTLRMIKTSLPSTRSSRMSWQHVQNVWIVNSLQAFWISFRPNAVWVKRVFPDKLAFWNASYTVCAVMRRFPQTW